MDSNEWCKRLETSYLQDSVPTDLPLYCWPTWQPTRTQSSCVAGREPNGLPNRYANTIGAALWIANGDEQCALLQYTLPRVNRLITKIA